MTWLHRIKAAATNGQWTAAGAFRRRAEGALPWPGPIHEQTDASRDVHIVVTSTALNAGALAAKCVTSIREQTHTNWEHVYFDASSDDDTFIQATSAAQDDPRISVRRAPRIISRLDNVLSVWRALSPETVIVEVDGDDALFRPDALAIVATMHANGAWLTYGQYQNQDGTLGCAAQIGPNPRAEPHWRLNHLHTFRAGLIQQVSDSDLRWPDGRRIDLCLDEVTMVPMAEMAAERAVFCPTVLYDYSGCRTTPKQIEDGQEGFRLHRRRRRYTRLSSL